MVSRTELTLLSLEVSLVESGICSILTSKQSKESSAFSKMKPKKERREDAHAGLVRGVLDSGLASACRLVCGLAALLVKERWQFLTRMIPTPRLYLQLPVVLCGFISRPPRLQAQSY